MSDLYDTLNTLDELLSKTKLEDVSAESQGFSELPDGYYLCEVEKANLGESKSSKQPMVSFTFKITEDGTTFNFSDDNIETIKLKNTKNRKLFKHYVLKDEGSVKRFVSDMLKFEGETAGEPILPKEAFLSSETLLDALDVLEGLRIYIQSDTKEKDDGTKSTWYNLISWKRANELELL